MSAWDSREFDAHERVLLFTDTATGLRAVISMHAIVDGQAVGGTRFKSYSTTDAAIEDALRLSRAMSYKCALAGFRKGGAKAVIIGDPAKIKTPELLRAYGRCVDSLGGAFVTAEDVGTTLADMEIINEVTPHIGGTNKTGGDPSIPTALGVLHGLRAVAEFKFGRPSFQGLRVAVQGLGAVGWRVAEGLHAGGATLLVADVAQDKVARAVAEFGAKTCDTAVIHAADVDIYSPCALGGTVTTDSAQEIRAMAVAGAANNPLATPEAGAELARRGDRVRAGLRHQLWRRHRGSDRYSASRRSRSAGRRSATRRNPGQAAPDLCPLVPDRPAARVGGGTDGAGNSRTCLRFEARLCLASARKRGSVFDSPFPHSSGGASLKLQLAPAAGGRSSPAFSSELVSSRATSPNRSQQP
jgi:leucine dehydrogenase